MSTLPPRVLCFDRFALDLTRGCLRDADQEIALPPKAFEVLRYLAENAGRLIPKDELIKAVWSDVFVSDDSLVQCIALLRNELGDTDRRLIKTVLRRGYRFDAPVSLEASVNASGPAVGSAECIDNNADERERYERTPQHEAERRQLTVMSCELLDVPAVDLEVLREVVGAFQSCVAETTGRLNGFVAKHIGNTVLVYFGYPAAHEDDAELAVRAGLDLCAALKTLKSGADVTLQCRVGIASSLVIVGDLVDLGERQERGIVGVAPIMATRLQAWAQPDTVAIDQTTRRLIGGLFDCSPIGAIPLIGTSQTTQVWQVLGVSAVESRFEALRGASLTPLVGRGEEIDLLLRRWQRAKAGQGQVALVSGEPGIGKSRLASTLQERLREQPRTQLRYSCSPQHHDSALYPVILQLEHAAGFKREDILETRLDKLEILLAQTGKLSTEMTGLIADLLGLAGMVRYPAAPPDPQRRRELILAGLIWQLEARARERPVLAIFEDAHWADSTSLELLDRMIERVAGLPVLLVITFRPEFAAPWVGQPHVSALSLNRLARSDVATMVNGITTGKDLPTEILDSIVERTDGIPLFVEELTNSLLEGGLLLEEDDAYVLAGPIPPLTIPSSLQALLLARLDRLQGVKEVAQMGAALGREFSYELLATVARCGDAQLRMALGQLTDAGLLFGRGTPPRASYLFKHALVQDVAYSTLLRDQRQKLHAGIAEALEEHLATHSDHAKSHTALLADHWFRAGKVEKALSYALEAARIAAKVYARPEAISHYAQALDLLENLPPTPERNRVHIGTIFALVDLPGWERNEAAKAKVLRHVDQALALAHQAGQLRAIAFLESLKGVHWEDEALLTNAIAYAESSGDVEVRRYTAFNYGTYLGKCARYTTALNYIAPALAIGDLPQEPLTFWLAMGGRCFSARAGNFTVSLDYARLGRATADKLGDARMRVWSAMEAEPYMYMGLWDKVIGVAEEWLPLAWEIREWPVVLWSSAWLAIAYLKLKQPARAKQVLERAFAEMPTRALDDREAYAVPYGRIAVAQLRLQMGNLRLALDAARQALISAQETRAPLEEGAAQRALGQVYEAMGTRGEAEAAFRSSLGVLEQIQCPPELAQTLLAYGRFRQGDKAREDMTLIKRALKVFEEMGATGWIEEARAALDFAESHRQ
jgi:DNA-binding winged helix-turn-helix (wHTH) protein/tetratricopeptide (TPR) repeat protein